VVSESSSSFVMDVAVLVRSVPRGRAVTYGDVARAVGRPSAARWVAGALRRASEADPTFPWHRVVAAGGRVSTFRIGMGALQTALLRSEGALTDDERVPSSRMWNPASVRDDA